MPEKQTFTEADLEVGVTSHVAKDSGVFTHTHTVIFDRPLTQAERHLFVTVLTSFYYTVRFSRQFGDGLVAEPEVKFDAPDRARYTFKQTALNGPWKDLLFAILANFSHEVVSIRLHDDSRIFEKKRCCHT